MNTTQIYQFLSKDSERKLLSAIDFIVNQSRIESFRSRYQIEDSIVARQFDPDLAKLDAEMRGCRDMMERPTEVVVPIVGPALDTQTAYLASIFLSTPEIFPMSAAPEYMETAEKYNILLVKYASEFQWRRNLLLTIQDGVRHNICAAEATWEIKHINKASNALTSDGTAKVVEAETSGFAIRHLDLYNTFWDTTVVPAEVSAEGDFAGYHEQFTTTKLIKFIERHCPDVQKNKASYKELLESQPVKVNYFTPTVIAANKTANSTKLDYDALFASGSSAATRQMHELTTIYMRIVPEHYGITKALDRSDTLEVWKFVVLNGSSILLSQRRTNMHGFLPIVLGQPCEDSLGYQTKSLTQELQPIQTLASLMWQMELDSQRRVIADRGIYDPTKIDSDHMNNPNPSAKMPIKPAASGLGLSNIYLPLDYRDPALGQRPQTAAQLSQFADRITGQNAVSQGGFIKGNKTNSQFDQTMANSNSRQKLLALKFEDGIISVIKILLEADITQFQPFETLKNPATGNDVEIKPNELRETPMDFEVSDGLMPTTDMLSTDVMTVALQTIGSSPELAAQYKLGELFAYLMASKGARHLRQFMKSKEQIDAETQARAEQQAATAGGAAGNPTQNPGESPY